jgi:uncharacterized protein
MEVAVEKLEQILKEASVDEGHGIDHALIVMDHACHALKHFPELEETDKRAVMLAALLHDADDGKFFDHEGYQNAEKVLESFPNEKEKVLKMISLVSCSKNGNEEHEVDWELIPRWCDRLEATGEIGIKRCETYTKHKGRPEYLPSTPRVHSLEEIELVATPERFAQYTGGSASMIDHFYDKLLHLKIDTGVPYIDQVMEKRHKEVVDFLLEFWETH